MRYHQKKESDDQIPRARETFSVEQIQRDVVQDGDSGRPDTNSFVDGTQDNTVPWTFEK